MAVRYFNSKYINYLGFAYKCDGTYEGRYAYGGQDYVTKDFSWVVADRNTHLVSNTDSLHPPTNALVAAYPQNNRDMVIAYYFIIAKSKYGLIPGFWNGQNAVYAYFGKENTTEDFDWIVLDNTGKFYLSFPRLLMLHISHK